MTIITMTESHLPKVYEIEKKSFKSAWDRQIFDEILASSSTIPLVAVINDEVVGFAIVNTVLDEATLMNIAVHPDFRKNGIGNTLLKTSIDESVKKNCAVIFLEVRISSLHAIMMYKKAGFQELSIRKNYYQNENEDALVMVKELYKEDEESSD